MMTLRMAMIAGAVVFAAASANAMEVTSAEMANGASLATAQVYGKCGGANISPSLSWSGAPASAKSFAVTVFDPDAHDTGWWHWIVFNIPADVHAIAKGGSGMPPAAVQGENDFGDNTYDGACPPPGSGLHHYQFTVWALGTPTIPFDKTTTGGKIGPWLKSHAVGSAVLTPVYQR